MPMSSQESPPRDSRLRLSGERSEPVSIPNPEFLRLQIGAELRSRSTAEAAVPAKNLPRRTRHSTSRQQRRNPI